MAGRIPDHFIEDLLSRVDLVELIDRHVPLKRAGKNYTCRCPFHQEKSPSFTVSPEKQFYYCFGCGASGNAVSFLMDYSHLSFVEAIEALSKLLGIEVQREGNDQPKGPDRRPLYDTLEKARAFYTAQLKNPKVRERARAYLKKRHLSADIVERFQLGFAPPGWDNLVSHLGQDGKGIQLLQKTGMAIQSEQGRVYDRFRDRIMFPIRDGKGRTVAFGGRVLGDEKPKYLNSPETEIFHKGETLYGFYEARQATTKLDRFLVVEGYMDVIALAQHGISFAVATLGTACTRDHVEALFRVVNEVVFCFDGDRAGRSAAWRALENTLPAMREGRSVRFHFLPEGEDPDTQVRKDGPELFLAGVQKAQPLPEYLFAHLMSQVDMNTLDGRARLVGLALPLIERLPKGILQELMINRLAEVTRLDKSSLWGVPAASTTPPIEPTRREPAPAPGNPPSFEGIPYTIDDAPPPRQTDAPARFRQPSGGYATPRRTAQPPAPVTSLVDATIRSLLQSPGQAAETPIPREVYELSLPHMGLLIELLEYLSAHPKASTAALLGRWHATDAGEHLAALAAREFLQASGPLQNELGDALRKLHLMQVEQQLDEQIRANIPNPIRFRELLHLKQELSRLKH